MEPTFSIRAATPDDVHAVVRLLGDSAESQGSRAALCVDSERLLRDGFGEAPRVHVLVAAAGGEIVGVALYFFTYSTWTSVNGLYLEDLFVAPAWRRHGIAAAFVKALARIAHEHGCRRFQWLVLRSNAGAVAFYRSLGATLADDWAVMQFGADDIDRLAVE